MKCALIGIVLCVAVIAVSAENTIEFGYSTGRVVGGQNAAPHSAPWIVSLQWGLVFPSQHCGGAIISPAWVVTAAHCVVGTNIGTFIMLAGRHNIGINENSEQRRNINRFRTWTHPSWGGTGGVGPFDIGMINAVPVFVFNQFVRAIALPQAGVIHSGSATLHGWGSTSTTNQHSFPNILQTVTKPIVPMNQCDAVFGPNNNLHYTNVCTGPLTGGVSACSGDSGGPLVQNNQLVGVVSWGRIPCGQVNAPSVYIRISAFIGWINGIMN